MLVRGFKSHILLIIAGWSRLVARWAHNPKVVGSNPAPAIGPLEQWFISSPCHGEDRQFKSDMDRKMAR